MNFPNFLRNFEPCPNQGSSQVSSQSAVWTGRLHICQMRYLKRFPIWIKKWIWSWKTSEFQFEKHMNLNWFYNWNNFIWKPERQLINQLCTCCWFCLEVIIDLLLLLIFILHFVVCACIKMSMDDQIIWHLLKTF